MSILPQLMPAEEQKSAHHKCPLLWKSLEVTARSGNAHNWTENVLKDRNHFRPLLDVTSDTQTLTHKPSLCVSREPINTVMSWPTSPMVITVLVTLPCASRKTIDTSGGLLSCVCFCDSQEFIKPSPLKCTCEAALL